ncbi:hypothetical protein CAAN1_01S11716 [[Candida] anglica]|uniref:Uncharacterized protein n=1 Tax=[Candida] anglica TaxID=148631 RepID=A0ABP0EKE7_9ASCO
MREPSDSQVCDFPLPRHLRSPSDERYYMEVQVISFVEGMRSKSDDEAVLTVTDGTDHDDLWSWEEAHRGYDLHNIEIPRLPSNEIFCIRVPPEIVQKVDKELRSTYSKMRENTTRLQISRYPHDKITMKILVELDKYNERIISKLLEIRFYGSEERSGIQFDKYSGRGPQTESPENPTRSTKDHDVYLTPREMYKRRKTLVSKGGQLSVCSRDSSQEEMDVDLTSIPDFSEQRNKKSGQYIFKKSTIPDLKNLVDDYVTTVQISATLKTIYPSPFIVKPYGRTLKIAPFKLYLQEQEDGLVLEFNSEREICKFLGLIEIEQSLECLSNIEEYARILQEKRIYVDIQRKKHELATGVTRSYWTCLTTLEDLCTAYCRV